MTLRDLAIRGVLALGALSAIATSAPPEDVREATATTSLAAGSTTHVTIRLTGGATHQAGRMSLYLSASPRGGAPVITVVPDDPDVAPFTLVDFVTLPIDRCEPGWDCTLGLRLEAAGTGLADVDVSADAVRDGDPSMCMPDDRTFSDAAQVEVTFDE
jgi:hypothetical protein